jgi:hypothetical protein
MRDYGRAKSLCNMKKHQILGDRVAPAPISRKDSSAPKNQRSSALNFSSPRHVDDEPIFHVALEHPFVGFGDLVDPDYLDVAGDPAFGAEIEHLLRLGDAADR